MRNIQTLTISLLLLYSGSVVAACSNVGEQLKTDEPRVKAYVQNAKPDQTLKGLKLCDDSILLNGWRLTRKVTGLDSSQNVYLFSHNGKNRAVAWVSIDGQPMGVPVCPYGKKCKSMSEPGFTISGDVYTWATIKPGGEIVLIWYPPSNW